MKSKKILITYFDSGDFAGSMAREILLAKIERELIDEGRVPQSSSITLKFKAIRFTDGTKITLAPYGQDIRGGRYTHVYIDESILRFTNAIAVLSSQVVDGEFENWDTSGDRIIIYNNKGETEILKTSKGE